MRAFPVLLSFLIGLACAAGGEPEPEPEPVEAPAPAPAPDPEPLPKASSYTTNVYGVCRKYTDCDCNPYGTVVACREEFGAAADAFPDDVWTCVLARDCASLCGASAGACFELYALKTVMAEALGGKELPTCAEGQSALHHFDASGAYLSTECK